MNRLGTKSYGIKMPIIKFGENLYELIENALEDLVKYENIIINDNDIIGVTEAVLARSQGNYASLNDISKEISNCFKGDTIGLLFPILSRNRFSMILEGISKSKNNIYIQASYPNDEFGNPLIDNALYKTLMFDGNKNLSEDEFIKLFGDDYLHPYTKLNYVNYYKSISENIKFVFSNNPLYLLTKTDNILVCSVHDRDYHKEILKKENPRAKILGLDDLFNKPVNNSGYNSKYGLLGSNKAKDDIIKLFPRDIDEFVNTLAKRLYKKFNKNIQVILYGDGAYKDPVHKIWELADPVSTIACTDGLLGTTNELKLKYLIDSELDKTENSDIDRILVEKIRNKDENLSGNIGSEGTTSRHISDLVASLCDLTSGSGDKGTPIVLIQNYFNTYVD